MKMISWKVCDCPCGNGQVTKHVEDIENGWSRPHIEHTLDCTKCNKEWRLSHQSLTLISSEAEYCSLRQKKNEAYERLDDLITSLQDDYFSSFQAKTKKAELEEMTRLGIADAKYQDYLRRRRNGQTPGQIGQGLNNKKWLLSFAESKNKKDKLLKLISEHESLEEKVEVSAKKIIRKSIP